MDYTMPPLELTDKEWGIIVGFGDNLWHIMYGIDHMERFVNGEVSA